MFSDQLHICSALPVTSCNPPSCSTLPAAAGCCSSRVPAPVQAEEESGNSSHLCPCAVLWVTACFLQASIMLEELGIPYETKSIAIGKNEQKQDW